MMGGFFRQLFQILLLCVHYAVGTEVEDWLLLLFLNDGLLELLLDQGLLKALKFRLSWHNFILKWILLRVSRTLSVGNRLSILVLVFDPIT